MTQENPSFTVKKFQATFKGIRPELTLNGDGPLGIFVEENPPGAERWLPLPEGHDLKPGMRTRVNLITSHNENGKSLTSFGVEPVNKYPSWMEQMEETAKSALDSFSRIPVVDDLGKLKTAAEREERGNS